MTDYTSLKVPELKKILQERGLTQSGNKADLIARLTESDKSKGSGEDEIDWDEDDTKIEPTVTAATAPTAGTGPVDTPIAVPNQIVDTDPSKTTDLKVTGGENAPVAADGAIAASGSTTAPVEPEIAAAPEPEAPKTDFSIGLVKSEYEMELEKRAKRAEKFKRTNLSEEDKKKAEEKEKAEARAKKFGMPVVNLDALDGALSEGRLKRGREEKDNNKVAGRPAKRPTPNPPNRRSDQPKNTANKSQQRQEKKALGKITDDPAEAAKAAARKARFSKAPPAKA